MAGVIGLPTPVRGLCDYFHELELSFEWDDQFQDDGEPQRVFSQEDLAARLDFLEKHQPTPENSDESKMVYYGALGELNALLLMLSASPKHTGIFAGLQIPYFEGDDSGSRPRMKEIDSVVVNPAGVHVFEIKYWAKNHVLTGAPDPVVQVEEEREIIHAGLLRHRIDVPVTCGIISMGSYTPHTHEVRVFRRYEIQKALYYDEWILTAAERKRLHAYFESKIWIPHAI